jgi:hypothetical protein
MEGMKLTMAELETTQKGFEISSASRLPALTFCLGYQEMEWTPRNEEKGRGMVNE